MSSSRAQPLHFTHLVVVQGLGLVFEPCVDCAQLGKHTRVIGHQAAEHLEPLDGGLKVARLKGKEGRGQSHNENRRLKR